MSAVEVGVVMGSASDWETMEHAVSILREFGIAHEARVVSAHRMPDDMFAYAEAAAGRGLKAIIAGAGGAHLPGMIAAKTTVPVLGVPVAGRHLRASIRCTASCRSQGHRSRPARSALPVPRAALFAVAMLATADPDCGDCETRARQTEAARNMTLPPSA